MVVYSPRMDWRINVDAKEELVKHWVDVSKIKISTTHGVIEISGELLFTGKAAGESEPMVINSMLKAIDRSLKVIPHVRDVVWRLKNWKKVGSRWIPVQTQK